MSLHQFITNILNIKPEQIQDLLTLNQSDGSMVIKIRLVDAHCICPYCNGQTHIHGYYPRKLTHSTFINRACTILYLQRSIVATPARLHSTNRIPSRIPMKALLMKLRLTYYRILNIRKLPTPSQPRETTYLKLWFSVFSAGMSILHANHCPKFYLSMSIICQTPIMSLFTAVS